MTISDYIRTATALLQREHPGRAAEPDQVLQRVMQLNPELDAGAVRSHISQELILALTGVGKEIWRRLGGSDTFIRDLRDDGFERTITC